MALRSVDLMVGDLLTLKDCVGDSGFPILKVNGILPDTLFVQIDYSDANDEVDYEDIIGIPLTPEILEKNGFKIIQTERVGPAFGPCAELRNERFYVKVFFNGNGTISTEIGNQVSLKNENGLADMRSFTCDWVNDMCIHQLQRALRLCGIEKEIVI